MAIAASTLRPRYHLVALAMATCLGSSTARAQAQSDERQALQLFEQSAELYEQGRLEEAAQLLKRAYALDPNPLLLYNLARVNEGLGELEEAVRNYRHYLAEVSEISDRGAIEKRIQSLRQQIAEREALIRAEREARQRERNAEARRQEERGPSPVPWLIAAVGGAGLGGGLVLGWLSNSAEDEAHRDPTFFGARDARERAETLALAANVSFVAGGLLTATGVTWGLLDWPSEARDTGMTVAVSALPAGVRIQGSF